MKINRKLECQVKGKKKRYTLKCIPMRRWSTTSRKFTGHNLHNGNAIYVTITPTERRMIWLSILLNNARIPRLLVKDARCHIIDTVSKEPIIPRRNVLRHSNITCKTWIVRNRCYWRKFRIWKIRETDIQTANQLCRDARMSSSQTELTDPEDLV